MKRGAICVVAGVSPASRSKAAETTASTCVGNIRTIHGQKTSSPAFSVRRAKFFGRKITERLEVSSQKQESKNAKTGQNEVMSKRNIQQPLRMIAVVTLIGAAGLSAFLALPLSAIGDSPQGPPVIDDTAMQVLDRKSVV